MKFCSVLFAAVFLTVSVQAVQAAGNKTGHDTQSTSDSGQGNTSNDNPNANPDNEGQTTTTETTTGPKGQLKQDNTDCNNCETTITIDLPGKNR